MTSRERLVAATRGGEVDRQPVIVWPGSGFIGSDAIVRPSVGGEDTDRAGDMVLLVEVANPFGRALRGGIDLNELLAGDPERGGEVLDGLVADTRREIAAVYDQGADGVLYLLHGACPEHCSPMQYGGHYLERDRELLQEGADAALNFLFVVGDRDLYLDFVSDLPAHLFGWDDRSSGISAAEGRALRHGAVATYGPEGDVLLSTSGPSPVQLLEKTRLGSAV